MHTPRIFHGSYLAGIVLSGCVVEADEPGPSTTQAPDASTDTTSSGNDTGTTATTTGDPVTVSATSVITSDFSTSGSDTSESGDPVCGDGTVDPGEECDDGENNADFGPCTTTCTEAVCGDGYVWVGTEECDLGPMNGTPGSGCSDTCTSLNICGDGMRDPATEECDAGDENGGDFCTADCSLAGLVVFVTSTTYNGNLAAFDPGGDGITGADAICKAHAESAGLHNADAFMAWLSASPESAPATRFPSEVKDDSLPFVLPFDGAIVAANWSQLTSGQLLIPLNRIESGALIREAIVWTNTTTTGLFDDAENHCAGWTSASADLSGNRGFADATNALWTEFPAHKCSQASHHLYCVEVATPENM